MRAVDTPLHRLISQSRIVTAVALLALEGCGGTTPLLNSDRILREFGSYGVDVLYSDATLRISSLYSESNAVQTTRTYAIVKFLHSNDAAYGSAQRKIVAGGSIGATFRAHGFDVEKQTILSGALTVPTDYVALGRGMRLPLPQTLAAHVYQLNVSKNGKSWPYARITEVHHPDYLTTAELQKILADEAGEMGGGDPDIQHCGLEAHPADSCLRELLGPAML